MKKTLYALTLCLLFLTCNKEEEPPTPTMPITPTFTPASEVEFVITSRLSESGYTIFEDLFIGAPDESTILTSDGNVIIVGGGRTGSANEEKMAIVKTNSTGEILYYKGIFNNRYGKALGVCEDLNQDIYVVGYVFNNDSLENREIAVVKLDVEGNILWEKSYAVVEGNVSASNIAILSSDEIVISGTHSFDQVLLKIDPSGEEILFDVKETPNYDSPDDMLVLEDGRILITSSMDQEILLSWYDEELNLIKKKEIGSSAWNTFNIIQLKDGNLLSTGHFRYINPTTNNIDSQAVFLVKLDIEGEILWESKMGDLAYLNNSKSIKENEDGSFVLTGLARDFTEYEHMLFYIDSTGNEINSIYYIGDETLSGKNLIKLENGRNVITGGYPGGAFFLNVDNYGM